MCRGTEPPPASRGDGAPCYRVCCLDEAALFADRGARLSRLASLVFTEQMLARFEDPGLA
jgi:hypothetical protein